MATKKSTKTTNRTFFKKLKHLFEEYALVFGLSICQLYYFQMGSVQLRHYDDSCMENKLDGSNFNSRLATIRKYFN
jgi:hypothetical protein